MQSKRGGAGRGQGRKPIKEGQDTVTVSLRLTTAQRDKLQRLGGAKWVRQRIDKGERWKRSTDNTIATGAREDASKDQTTPAWRPVDVYVGHDRQGDY